MARIVVYSMGHRGDIYPYVPIARELARRGHEVRFVLPREFHPQLAGEPFACVHSGTDFGPLALDAHGAFLARWGKRMGGVMTMRLYFGKFTVPHLATVFETLDSELANAHLLIPIPRIRSSARCRASDAAFLGLSPIRTRCSSPRPTLLRPDCRTWASL